MPTYFKKIIQYFSENVLNKGVKFYNLYEGSWKFDDKKDRKKDCVFAIAIVLRSFDQMTIDDRDLDREKKDRDRRSNGRRSLMP